MTVVIWLHRAKLSDNKSLRTQSNSSLMPGYARVQRGGAQCRCFGGRGAAGLASGARSGGDLGANGSASPNEGVPSPPIITVGVGH